MIEGIEVAPADELCQNMYCSDEINTADEGDSLGVTEQCHASDTKIQDILMRQVFTRVFISDINN